jgi:hypothetical protein
LARWIKILNVKCKKIFKCSLNLPLPVFPLASPHSLSYRDLNKFQRVGIITISLKLGSENVHSSVRFLGHWLVMVAQLFNIYIDWSCIITKYDFLPTWPHNSQGLFWFGLNSSLRIVKWGSCVANPKDRPERST